MALARERKLLHQLLFHEPRGSLFLRFLARKHFGAEPTRTALHASLSAWTHTYLRALGPTGYHLLFRVATSRRLAGDLAPAKQPNLPPDCVSSTRYPLLSLSLFLNCVALLATCIFLQNDAFSDNILQLSQLPLLRWLKTIAPEP